MYYTLVQHSGFAIGGKPEFERAVEMVRLGGSKTIAAVRRVGGLLFDDYAQAAEAEYSVNYPPGNRSLIPRVRGTFSKVAIEERPIYVPEPEET